MAEDSQSSSIIGSQSTSQRQYDQLVFFNWARDCDDHFFIVNVSSFQSTEIKEAYYKYQLVAKSRIRKLKSLKSYPGESLSLFAKIEKGKIFFLY